MTLPAFQDKHEPARFTDIIARDETNKGWSEHIAHGLTGLVLLMGAGVVILLLVLWKSV